MQKSGWMVFKAERIEGSEMGSSFSYLMIIRSFVNSNLVLFTSIVNFKGKKIDD